MPGAVGAEMRAIIATNRRVLEHIASDWMNRHVDDLFGGDLGPITFEQTLAWDRPTPWFLGRFRQRLAVAAFRGEAHTGTVDARRIPLGGTPVQRKEHYRESPKRHRCHEDRDRGDRIPHARP